MQDVLKSLKKILVSFNGDKCCAGTHPGQDFARKNSMTGSQFDDRACFVQLKFIQNAPDHARGCGDHRCNPRVPDEAGNISEHLSEVPCEVLFEVLLAGNGDTAKIAEKIASRSPQNPHTHFVAPPRSLEHARAWR